jgi:multisubunit Na+/H+ antiporter MnhB subunit
MHPSRLHHSTGWGQPPPGWSPSLSGWAPLVDPGPRSLQAARSLGRWWWPILTVAGFLAVVVQVLDHDPPAPGLSMPGLLTIALAAAVVALLTIHRRYGLRPLARALSEYTVVALLATLLAAPGIGQPADPANPTTASQAKAAAGDHQPGVFRAGATVLRAVTRAARALAGAVRWVVDVWRQASQKADAANDQAMATPPPSLSPSAASSWRSYV